MRTTLAPLCLILSGCASGLVTANAPCYVQPGQWRVGDPNVTAHMTVLNVGRSCAWSATTGGVRNAGGRVIDQAQHGRALIRNVASGTLVDYYPAKGFAGTDQVRVVLGAEQTTYTIMYDVIAPSQPRS